MKKLFILSFMILLIGQYSNAQCTSCTTTLNSNSNNYTFIAGTTCVDGTVTIENAVTFETGASVCIKTGSTLNLNNVNNFYFPTGDVTIDIYGILNINGNPTFGGNIHFVVHSGGSLTSSGAVKFGGTSSSLTNNGTVTVPNIELSSGKNMTIDNNSTMTVNGNMNLASGTSFVRNQATLSVASNYSTSATSVYVNCGTYTGQFNLGGGKVINTGTFTTSQIDVGGNSNGRFENYNKVNLTGNLNMGGLNSVFYNQGVVDASIGNGNIQSDGNLTGPTIGKGYFILKAKTVMNNGNIGPNLNFTRSDLGASTTRTDVFNNGLTVEASVTFGEDTPSISPSSDCPNADGSTTIPTPTTSTACAGVNLITLQPAATNVTYEWWTGTSATRTTQITSSTTPKVTCYTTVGTVYLWAKSNGSDTYSASGAAVTVEDCATAWKTTGNGTWSDTGIWQYRTASGGWVTIASPPYNNKPVYISDGTIVTIPSTLTSINADSLVIETTGKLVVSNPLSINSPLVFEIGTDGNAGELQGSCGNVTMGASSKLIARKTLDNTWDFISFPFEVTSGRIFLAGTSTPANWGDMESNIADAGTINFIAAYYDGATRSSTPGSYSPTSSKFFKSLTTHTFNALQGYIISGGLENDPGTITLDFCSATGTSLDFCDKSNVSQTYIAGSLTCHCGWNLAGTPYVANYNLKYATALYPYYIYDGSPYSTVGATTNFSLNPFGAFFVKSSGTGQSLNYNDLGLTDFTSGTTGYFPAPAFKQVILEVSQSTYSDNTLIRLEEDADAAFKEHEDGVKMSTTNTAIPQIYTEAEGACSSLAINVLPMNTERVNLKVKFGQLGLNTIKLIDIEKAIGFSSVTLVDSETGLKTNLLKDNYSFENTVTGESNRFFILFSQTDKTGIIQTSTGNIKAIVTGNDVQLSGIEGQACITVYDVVGKSMGLYQLVSNNQSIRIPQQGIYLIDVLTETQHSNAKVIIK